ncbi:MAG: hypothetical protein VB948_02560, partial [Pseudomonadales bacterium]
MTPWLYSAIGSPPSFGKDRGEPAGRLRDGLSWLGDIVGAVVSWQLVHVDQGGIGLEETVEVTALLGAYIATEVGDPNHWMVLEVPGDSDRSGPLMSNRLHGEIDQPETTKQPPAPGPGGDDDLVSIEPPAIRAHPAELAALHLQPCDLGVTVDPDTP